MNTLFDVPCPDCGRHMSVSPSGECECPSCRRTYRARMGHLFPVGATADPAAARRPTVASS